MVVGGMIAKNAAGVKLICLASGGNVVYGAGRMDFLVLAAAKPAIGYTRQGVDFFVEMGWIYFE